MKTCLFVHANIYAFGGAELYAVRMIALLARNGFEVTVVHVGGPLDTSRIAAWSGIRLDPKRVRFVTASLPVKGVERFSLLAYSWAIRHARAVARQFDLVVGGYGECPLPNEHVLQIIHVPLFGADVDSFRHVGVRPNPVRTVIRSLYAQINRRLAGWGRATVAGHPAICNSRWTANQFRKAYPTSDQPAVIYPGASTNLMVKPDIVGWRARQNRAVILGRIVPGKRVELAVEIVNRIRAAGESMQLVIVGNGRGSYSKYVEQLVRENAHIEWVRGASKTEVEKIASESRWGLHCAEFEHYGIAAIELQRLGCLTLVPNSCGQAEVAPAPVLVYESAQDCAEKMLYLSRADDAVLEQLHGRRWALVNEHTVAEFDARMSRLIESSAH